MLARAISPIDFKAICIENFDFAKANSFLAPEARWIEYSLPEKAGELPDWWRNAKMAGVHINFQLHDIDVHV